MTAAPHEEEPGRSSMTIRSWPRRHRWLVVATAAVLSFWLGYVGIGAYFERIDEPQSWLNLLYLTFQIYTFNLPLMDAAMPWQLEVARFAGPAVVAYTAVEAALAIFRDQFELMRARRSKDHVIVCGLGAKGQLLVSALREKGRGVVVIERERVPTAEAIRAQGAIVVIGDATEDHDLLNAGLHGASHIVAVCGNDGINAEISVRARLLSRERAGSPLTCIAHVTDPSLAELLQETEISGQRIDRYRLELFNVFAHGARSLIERYSPLSSSENVSPANAHLLIVGLGYLGSSVVVEVARRWHDAHRTDATPLRITIIDAIAKRRWDLLEKRFVSLRSICEVRLVEQDTTRSELIDLSFLEQSGVPPLSHAFVCIPDEGTGIAVALRIAASAKSSRTVVCTNDDRGLGVLLQPEISRASESDRIDVFGLLNATCTADLLLQGRNEFLAREIHRAYVSSEKAHGKTPATNPALVDWDDLTDDLRESNRGQADHIAANLASIGYGIRSRKDWGAPCHQFSPDEIERLAIREHERWLEERCSGGWIHTPNEARKPGEKKSPDLCDWVDLSEEAREKDRAAVREIPQILKAAGYEVYTVSPGGCTRTSRPS